MRKTMQKKKKKKAQNGSAQPLWRNSSHWKLCKQIYTLFKAKMFTLAAKLRCLPYLKWVHMFDCVSEGVDNIFDLFFTPAVWTHFMFFLLIFYILNHYPFYIIIPNNFFEVPIHSSYLGKCYNNVLLWSSRNVLQTKKLPRFSIITKVSR